MNCATPEEVQTDDKNSLTRTERFMSLKREEVNASAQKIPVFLRKTYNIINACNVSIATWSEDGLSFVVKDIELFSSRVLSRYFKNNKFSSFVRKLNLYGFRVLSKQTDDNIKLKCCEFKHEYFRCDRPDLLSQIRKSKHSSKKGNTLEVKELRTEVKELRTTVLTMAVQLSELISLVNNLQSSASDHDVSLPKPEEDCSYENQTSPICDGRFPQHQQDDTETTPTRVSSMNATIRKRKQSMLLEPEEMIPEIVKTRRVLPATTETISLLPNTTGTSTPTYTAIEAGSVLSSPLHDEFGLSVIEENCYPSTEEKAVKILEDEKNFNNEKIESSWLDMFV